MSKSRCNHGSLYFMFKWLALASLVGLLTGCDAGGNDSCHDIFYTDADSERLSSTDILFPSQEKRDQQINRCTRHQPVSPTSQGYVIHQKQLYWREQESSTHAKCVLGLGVRLYGLSCLFGKTTYSDQLNHFFPLEHEPEPGAIRVLGAHYAIANGKVYYQQFVVPGGQSLPAQVPLQILPLPASATAQQRRDSNYAMYGDQIFFKNRLVDGADLASFQPLYLPYPAPDDERLVFSYDFARDKYRVYWQNLMLDDSDPASFKIVDTDEGTDMPAVGDNHHRWRVVYDFEKKEKELGLIAHDPPDAVGGHFFRSRFTSPQGMSYARVQWSNGGVLYPLPLRMSEGDEFTVLPVGCAAKTGTLEGYPGISCAQLDNAAVSDFGRTKNKVYFRAREVAGADAASFRVIAVSSEKGNPDRGHAFAIDARQVYNFWDYQYLPEKSALQGPVIGPIPDQNGVFRFLSSGTNIYDISGSQDTRGLANNLCRYIDGQPTYNSNSSDPMLSTRGLKEAARDKGQGDQPYIELANDRYRYVFYDKPAGNDNPSHVIDLRTGKQLMMYGIPCDPAP